MNSNGWPHSGTFGGVPEDTSLDRLSTVSWLTRATGQKRWIYVGLFSPGLIAGGCVVDVTYTASGFAFAFLRQDRELLDHNCMAPRVRRLVPDSPAVGRARFCMPGAHVKVENDARPGGFGRRLEVRMGCGKGRLKMDLEVEDDGRRVEPLCAITTLPGGHMSYTLKSVGLPVRGTVTMGHRTVEVVDALAAVDYTHCLPEHHTRWYWACAAGSSDDGRILGLNLVSGWNVQRPAENAAWINGRLVALGPVEFTPGKECWQVESDELSLRFFPEGERRQDLDLKVIASHYVQPFGRFEGRLRCGGETLRFHELWGVTEDHEALW